jgi:hypothetical protein
MFEPKRLLTYTDQDLVAEIQRVAALIPGPFVTLTAFDRHAKVDTTTLRNRFGGWREALEAAGLAHRYNEAHQRRSQQEVIDELQRVASLLGTTSLSRTEFERHSRFGQKAVANAFEGSWHTALSAAGLRFTAIRAPSDDLCFENLLSVWTHYGRQPHYAEMRRPPSVITGKAYVRRWGGWTRAVYAFVQAAEEYAVARAIPETPAQAIVSSPPPDQGPRTAPVGLRYLVLRRDRFRCVLCGRSPATEVGCELHIDHIQPYSLGGLTTLENLRSLCAECNLGKRDRLESGG